MLWTHATFYYFHVHPKLIVDGHQNLIIKLEKGERQLEAVERSHFTITPGIDEDDVAFAGLCFRLALFDRSELINCA